MNQSFKLSSKLGQLLNVPPISIEILPGDGSEWLTSDEISEHAPFLFDESNLGVPQKLAYKAYLEAVTRFRQARICHVRDDEPDAPRETLLSTAVLLLLNPAHQSALNARKQLVERESLEASHELRFTDALLSLREGSKQSILWHHRRWLLRRMHMRPPSIISPNPAYVQRDGTDTLHGFSLNASVLRTEFAVVSRACETYPRNYHAWTHRVLCAQVLISLLFPSSSPYSSSSSPSLDSSSRVELTNLLEEERAWVRTWIERHISDYSAMQYCCRFETLIHETLPAMVKPASSERIDDGSQNVYRHALNLVRVYPTHESLWLYLRGALSFNSLAAAEDEGSTERDVRLFTRRLLENGDIGAEAKGHAIRLFAWMTWRKPEERLKKRDFVRRIARAAHGEAPINSQGALLCYLEGDVDDESIA